MTKYALIITNFLIIFVLVLTKRRKQVLDQTKKVLFVTAHPDDESMFFLPTFANLRQQYSLHLLCFTNGNYDNLGPVREKELEAAAKYLGSEKLTIVSEKDICDGPQSKWPISKMTQILKDYVTSQSINAIISFDQQGISGHPNHIDVFRSVKNLVVEEEEFVKSRNLKIYTL